MNVTLGELAVRFLPVEGARYDHLARRMDRITATLIGVIPAGWHATGVALLVLPSVPANNTDVAVALGGVARFRPE